MTVLYVLRYWPTLTETFVYREIEAVRARGVRVVVAALGSRADGVLQDQLPDVPVVRPPHGWRTLTAVPSMRHRAPWRWARRHLRARDAARALWLGDVARRIGAMRVHAHFAGEAAEWAFVAARVAGVPFSVTAHAVDLFRPRPSLPDLLRAARPAVTVTEHHRRWIADHYGVEAVVVRCGVQPDRYPAARPAAQGPLRVVSVARWVPKKGLDDLVSAARRVPDVHLRLVSDAPIPHEADRIEVGPLAPGLVPEALARSHLFALPCRIAPDGDRDGLPVALIEAMAAGLPVLSTPVSGIPELVDEEVGWMVPPDNPDALVAALTAIASDPDERARRGLAGRARVVADGWTVEAQASALLQAWGAAR